MAYKVVDCDNIRETFIGANSTTITLGGAAQYSRSLSSKLASGDTFYGAARAGAEIAVGKFTYNGATVAQTAIRYSSNSNNPVTFSSGAAGEIFVDLIAGQADTLYMEEITVASAATMDIGAVDGLRIASSGVTGPVTSLGTTANKIRIVRWSGQTVNHHSTLLNLLGGANWVTSSGDVSILTSDASGGWREITRAASITVTMGQIAFPATQNASANANTFDDYEEGTWTPSLSFAGGSTGITYSAQSASYTKAGRLVHLTCRMVLSSKGSSTGNSQINGLPFAYAGTATWACMPLHGFNMGAAITADVAGQFTGGSAITLVKSATDNAVPDVDFTNTTEFRFMATYEAAT